MRLRASTARIVLASWFVLLAAEAAFGQGTTGSISGIVKDSIGTPVPEAIIAITNPANNFSRAVTTNTTGLFVATQIPPAVYTVSVEKAGFPKLVKTGFVLTAGNQLSTGILVLEAAALGETVVQAADEGHLEIQST